jgi:hypothetical protein
MFIILKNTPQDAYIPNKVRVFGNRVVKRLYGPKRDEVT